jgi:hypothetical protein
LLKLPDVNIRDIRFLCDRLRLRMMLPGGNTDGFPPRFIPPRRPMFCASGSLCASGCVSTDAKIMQKILYLFSFEKSRHSKEKGGHSGRNPSGFRIFCQKRKTEAVLRFTVLSKAKDPRLSSAASGAAV